jgi:DNA-binding beta-propeller fold protein YncE
MARLARVALWLAAAVVVLVGIAVALLTFPGQPASNRSLRFDGFVRLPEVKNSGALTLLDYLTVSGDHLFVTNVSTGAVYKVGLHTAALPGAADVSVFESEPAAHGVAIDPAGRLAFVTRSGANAVDVFDPKTMRSVGRIPVAPDPDAIVYDPSAKLIYAASGDGRAGTLIDPVSQKVAGVIPLGGEPEFAAVDPATGLLYQNLSDADAVVAVDVAKRAVMQRWPLVGCSFPTGMAIDPANRRLFIACGKSSKLLVFDLDRHRVIASVPIGFGADSVAYDPALRRIYTTGPAGRLCVIDQTTPDSYRVGSSIRLHFNAHTLAVDPATHRLYVGYASLFIAPRLAVFTPIGGDPDTTSR